MPLVSRTARPLEKLSNSSPAATSDSAEDAVEVLAPSVYSGLVPLRVTKRSDGLLELKDSRTGVCTKLEGNEVIAFSPDDLKRTSPSHLLKCAFEAQYDGQMTMDFQREVLGHHSLDDQGAPVPIHLYERFVPEIAWWINDHVEVSTVPVLQGKPAITLDIMGHEVEHGREQRISRLGASPESRALKEGISDCFGIGVKWFAAQRNSAVAFGWGVADQAGAAWRHVDEPTRDGKSIDHLADYYPAAKPHLASGIVRKAFYLMVEGGEHAGSRRRVAHAIGMEKALKVFDASLSYLSSSAGFQELREACVTAAEALFGERSLEARVVREAWSTVMG